VGGGVAEGFRAGEEDGEVRRGGIWDARVGGSC
jgi:hypothetical protein